VKIYKQMSAWRTMVAVGKTRLLTSLHARTLFVEEFVNVQL
jgi:hypothetical protein